jgi:hypothetical protein
MPEPLSVKMTSMRRSAIPQGGRQRFFSSICCVTLMSLLEERELYRLSAERAHMNRADMMESLRRVLINVATQPGNHVGARVLICQHRRDDFQLDMRDVESICKDGLPVTFGFLAGHKHQSVARSE